MRNDFGKDLGLLHKVVVSGREVGADLPFWTSLADDRQLFGCLVSVVEHVGVLRTVGVKPTEPLIRTNTGILGNFFTRAGQIVYEGLGLEDAKRGTPIEDFLYNLTGGIGSLPRPQARVDKLYGLMADSVGMTSVVVAGRFSERAFECGVLRHVLYLLNEIGLHHSEFLGYFNSTHTEVKGFAGDGKLNIQKLLDQTNAVIQRRQFIASLFNLQSPTQS